MADEHMVAIVSFEGALKREVKRVRRELAKFESLSEMHLTIKVSGRVHEGDLNLTYGLSKYDFAKAVEGDTVQAVVDEFLRQQGWQAVHAPKAIGYDKTPSDDTDPLPDDEIPF